MSALLHGSRTTDSKADAPMIGVVQACRSSAQNVSRRTQLASLSVIGILTFVVFWPTLHNGFLPLGFDDGLILDTAAIREFSWQNLHTMLTKFQHAHYVPLTLLSLAVDYHFWGLNPLGYHCSNVLLHATAAMLVCVFLWPVAGSAGVALLASLIFALHPLQMEAVSVAVQRKTVLSGVLFFLTLILYQRWKRTHSRWDYVACVATFFGAALAKPSVVTLPLILVLYDYAFVDGRVRFVEKLPFAAIAAAAVGGAIGAHAAVGAIHPPHGGNLIAHLLMISRVALEYVDALFFPLNLSPIYYYPKAMVYSPLNFLALALILSMYGYVTLRRRAYPWSFFCMWWSLLVLLPESNLVPLAQLRADRFVYLVIAAFGLWIAVGTQRLQASTIAGRWRPCARLLGPVLVGILATLTYRSAGVWRDNVSAWSRVRERHPWCAMAHNMMGRAYYVADDSARAERALRESVRLSADLSEAHLYLARVYAERGQHALAKAEARRFLELAPGDSEGLQLLAAMSNSDRP